MLGELNRLLDKVKATCPFPSPNPRTTHLPACGSHHVSSSSQPRGTPPAANRSRQPRHTRGSVSLSAAECQLQPRHMQIRYQAPSPFVRTHTMAWHGISGAPSIRIREPENRRSIRPNRPSFPSPCQHRQLSLETCRV